MVLYQRRKVPYTLRLLAILFNPGVLLLYGFVVFLIYLGITQKKIFPFAIFVVLIALFIVIVIRLARKSIITHTYLIETDYQALHIQQLHFDEEIDLLIPEQHLTVEYKETKDRRRSGEVNKNRQIFKSLIIRDKRKPEVAIQVYGNEKELSKILEGLQSEKLTVLSSKEQQVIASNTFNQKFKTGYRLIVVLIALGVIGYYYYSNQTGFRKWFAQIGKQGIPLFGTWIAETGGVKYMIEFSPSDSSYTESIFGQKGRISYVPPDSVNMASARLRFHNRNNQFLEYNISVSDTVMNLTVPSGQPAQKLTRLTSFTNERTDTFTLFMLCFEEFLFPKNYQVIDSITNLVIGKHEATHSAAVLFKSDTLFMGVLQTETGKETWLVLLDTKKKSMLEYRRVWESDDATCTNTFDYHPGQMPTIIQRIACKGKQLVIRRYAVNPDGQLFLMEP